MWNIAFTALLVATFVSAAVAHADSASDYVAAVTSQGVIADRDALIGAADDLCNAAVQQNQGGIFVGISPNITAAMRTQATLGFDNQQLSAVIRAARNIDCPQNGPV
ncbi:DUF732 domain-containing protein [Mycobacterium sp. Z3061]|uniref:DUF732 domain-containing protein n=1 Tax=Mycobacterium sp. Z3061 TaxID=3073562 RepID=UPI00287384D6|nr:DUF732 domain-containing protein [Mycobacterium sp. Z3061]